MKKQFVVGMLMVTFLVAPAFAGNVEAVDLTPKIEETLKTVNHDVFGKIEGAPAGMNRAAHTTAEDKMLTELGIHGADALNVKKVLEGAQSQSRLNSLATLVAARRVAVSIHDASVNETVEALIQTLGKADMDGQYESKLLSQQDREMVTEVNQKLESPDMIKKVLGMKKSAREEWTNFLKERTRLMREVRPTPSGEEASLQALINLKKITKEAAIEKLRQMKECV